MYRYISIHRYIYISIYAHREMCTYSSLYMERSTMYIPGHAQVSAPTTSSGSRVYGAAAPATPSASAYRQRVLRSSFRARAPRPRAPTQAFPPYAAPCRPKGTERGGDSLVGAGRKPMQWPVLPNGAARHARAPQYSPLASTRPPPPPASGARSPCLPAPPFGHPL